MKGMQPSPMAVTVHFLSAGDERETTWCLASRYLEMAQIRLMVRPGMMTEARPCQMRVSRTAAEG